jgi:multiple sugar transport system ATP-binding protein
MATIEFSGVTKRYGRVTAVEDLSFRIADNEFFCVFGPPSSGKTTILRLLLGLEQPDAGEIRLDGRDVTALPPAARDIAMVFQNLALFPHMSARDNIRFPLVERRVPEATMAARVADAATRLHIGHILHKPPAQLSGGERQRVAIARALVRDPAAYLMDDPISALDARLREETRVELKRIQRDLGRTVVYVTHDQEEAMSVADRMAILEAGRIRQIGTPGDIYDRPATRYVANLVGAPPINLIAGRVERGVFHAARDGFAIGVGDVAAGGDVELGVRPEDVTLTAADAPGALPARIFEVEPLGGFTVVDVERGGQILRALVRGQPQLRTEAEIGLVFDPRKLHLFAKDGGVALARAATALGGK